MDVEAIDAVLFDSYLEVCAAENWSSLYSKDPKTHAKLIRAEAVMEQNIRRFFRDMAKSPARYVDWSAYQTRLNALKIKTVAAADDFSVNVIVNDDGIDTMNDQFVKIVFDDILNVNQIGANAGLAIYNRQKSSDTLSSALQRAARDRVAYLVGKKLDSEGHIIDNPKAEYRVSDVLRSDIRESITTSLSLGEDQADASGRLSSIIQNPSRASLIAQTEAVNGYQGGLMTYGKDSGAVGKEWQNVGATDECADNSDAGIVDIDDDFPSGDDAPAAHPNCRCGLRMVYPEELSD